MNNHLLSLFHCQNVRKCGFKASLEPLVRDLKILESNGTEVHFPDESVYGNVAQVTRDDVGQHTPLGYVEFL